jgi:hypothetical protein
VLKAHGTNRSSAALFIIGLAKMARPASLQPDHPLHSTKLAKIGLPVAMALSMACS